MTQKASKSIRLMVNRQEQLLLVESIVYAQVTDKLCKIYINQREPLEVFLSIGSLMSMLPKDEFLQISRSCVVATKAIRDIDEEHVVLSDGTLLPYAKRKKPSLLSAFQTHLSNRAQLHRYTWTEGLHEEFQCFDRSPIPFCILERIADSSGTVEYVFRYANDSLAALIHVPLHLLVNSLFSAVFAGADRDWEPLLSECTSRRNELIGRDLVIPAAQKKMRVLCYQAHYDLYACLLLNL